jgi:hypothetical protein
MSKECGESLTVLFDGILDALHVDSFTGVASCFPFTFFMGGFTGDFDSTLVVRAVVVRVFGIERGHARG